MPVRVSRVLASVFRPLSSPSCFLPFELVFEMSGLGSLSIITSIQSLLALLLGSAASGLYICTCPCWVLVLVLVGWSCLPFPYANLILLFFFTRVCLFVFLCCDLSGGRDVDVKFVCDAIPNQPSLVGEHSVEVEWSEVKCFVSLLSLIWFVH
jgi:hypothetical protein